MRIAFVSVSDQLGGSEAMLLQIATELRRSAPSWDLHMVLPGAGPLAGAARAAGVGVSVLPPPASLVRLGEAGLAGSGRGAAAARLVRVAVDLPPYARALRRLLDSLAPDVVHTNGFKAHVLGARTRRGTRAVVWHLHEYVSGRPLSRRLLRRHAPQASILIANSQSVAADVRTAVGPRADIRVIYNAVDIERFAPEGPAFDLDAAAGLPPAPPGTIRVGLVATFSRWKGHGPFLRAVAALPAGLPVRAYVVGGAVYDTAGSQYSEPELRRVAADCGIADRVGFTGFVREADRVMRALDVVVHASTMPEPFGLVIAEAMACGRAVVVSAAGGAAELVQPGVDALTHRPGDVEGLAAALQALAQDAALRVRLGGEARASARRRFDARRLATEFAAVYEAAAVRRVVAS